MFSSNAKRGENNVNTKDTILQDHFPTVMAPKYEALDPCETGKTRLIVGHDGLYIETRQVWGHLVRKLWNSGRMLPYGIVREIDTFRDIVNAIWPVMHAEVLPHAATFAEKDKEWAGYITHTPYGLKYLPLTFHSTDVSASYEIPKLPEDHHLVVDIHSHHGMEPCFSPTDDEDDKGGVRIRMVLGAYQYKKDIDEVFFRWVLRYSVEGFFIDWRGHGEN